MEAGKRAKGPSRPRATKNATISTKRNPNSDKFSFAKDPFQPSHHDLCDLNIGPNFTMYAQAADPISIAAHPRRQARYSSAIPDSRPICEIFDNAYPVQLKHLTKNEAMYPLNFANTADLNTINRVSPWMKANGFVAIFVPAQWLRSKKLDGCGSSATLVFSRRAHGMDEGAQGADVHIGLTLQLGNRGLVGGH